MCVYNWQMVWWLIANWAEEGRGKNEKEREREAFVALIAHSCGTWRQKQKQWVWRI